MAALGWVGTKQYPKNIPHRTAARQALSAALASLSAAISGALVPGRYPFAAHAEAPGAKKATRQPRAPSLWQVALRFGGLVGAVVGTGGGAFTPFVVGVADLTTIAGVLFLVLRRICCRGCCRNGSGDSCASQVTFATVAALQICRWGDISADKNDMTHPTALHTAFLSRFTGAWIRRDPTEMEGLVADDLVMVLRPGSEPVVGKDTVMHRLGNLWVVQQDVWADWIVTTDTDDRCRIIGRAGFTNAAYFTEVVFDGTTTVVFRDGLAARIEFDIAASIV